MSGRRRPCDERGHGRPLSARARAPSSTAARLASAVLESIGLDDVPAWALEQVGRERRRDVDLVEVGLPNPFLDSGLTLVDTPGVGGLNAGHAAATLAFLPSADALVFVTDASAELSGPELEFLASARGAGPPVLVAVTKIDMYPEWRRIVDIDARHLQPIGLVERPFALSSDLHARTDERDDESGYGAFADALRGRSSSAPGLSRGRPPSPNPLGPRAVA